MTLLPEVEHALMTAIRTPEPARRPGRRPGWSGRRWLGPAATVAMVSLTLAIFVGALVLLHRAGTSGPSQGAASSRPTVAGSRQTLLATLGVLRRPEQGPKVNLTSVPLRGINPAAPLTSGPARGLTLDRPLTRTVALVNSPYTAVLLPVRRAAIWSAPATEALDVLLAQDAARSRGGAGVTSPSLMVGPIGVSDVRAHGVLLVPSGSSNAGAIVVPDAVTRVQIGPQLALNPGRWDRSLTRNLRMPGQIRPVTATVSDNVAGFALGRINGRIANGIPVMLGAPVRLQTTWFGAAGEVIARPTVPAIVWVHVRSPLP
jgi:hypothetical protein